MFSFEKILTYSFFFQRFYNSGFQLCATPTLQYIVHSYRIWVIIHLILAFISIINYIYNCLLWLQLIWYNNCLLWLQLIWYNNKSHEQLYKSVICTQDEKLLGLLRSCIEITLCSIHKLIKTALPNWAIFTNIKATPVSDCVFDQTPQVSRFYNLLKSVGFHCSFISAICQVRHSLCGWCAFHCHVSHWASVVHLTYT